MTLEKRSAYWTYEDEDGERAYYFAPLNRAPGPYFKQAQVTAILDIAANGTLAGIELVMGDLPPAPTNQPAFTEAQFEAAARAIALNVNSPNCVQFDECPDCACREDARLALTAAATINGLTG